MTSDDKQHTCPECAKLRAELIEWLGEAMRSEAYCEPDGPYRGWWDTMAKSYVMDIGDRLVELGAWDRHPDGYGRRWFYRPIERKEG